MKDDLLEKYATAKTNEPEEQDIVDLGPFGFLRGIYDRALMLELRFKDGRRFALGYAWLHQAEFDASRGMSLSFGGRKVTIIGQNLNAEIRPNIRLFDAVLRHRVPWIQEASAPAALRAGRAALIIEKLEVSGGQSSKGQLAVPMS
ncbi:MAG TPA: hypothetical protein VGN12_28040 [Pirellulales bacterium]|jgi:hypothetical protein